MHGITLVAARDLADRLIRVNTIAPGVFDTPMLARLRPDIREALEKSVPHPSRLGAPDDYAKMALSLLENSYVNGRRSALTAPSGCPRADVSHPNHAIAEAYLSAVTAGDLPDSLLTDYMTAWLTTQGPISKSAYQGAIRLPRGCASLKIRFALR